ncbi:cell division topological specificity factor MinE [Clostridium sp. UBA1056]|jgi:cell division topological specificity factor|uniref:cell division topological specificity factor MinE n=1 Tax=unclassified Clostridium TaxID=2614128 RepID=UPI003217CD0A
MDLFKIFSSKVSSKDIAADRLKLILVHDRATVSPDFLENIKVELLKTISNYAEIDSGEEIEVRITTSDEYDGSSPALVASIPIKKVKTR